MKEVLLHPLAYLLSPQEKVTQQSRFSGRTSWVVEKWLGAGVIRYYRTLFSVEPAFATRKPKVQPIRLLPPAGYGTSPNRTRRP